MKKYVPLCLILLAMAAAYYFGLHDYLTLENLKHHRAEIKRFALHHPVGTPLLFLSIYIFSTAITLPLDAFFCVTAGFLFTQPFCTLYILIGGVIGGSLLFLAANTAFADLLRRKAGPHILKLEGKFQKDKEIYLIFMRLIPILPGWTMNVVPALFNTPFRTFVWTSAIGIIPGAFVFSQAGKGLGKILDSWGPPDWHDLFTIQFFIGIGAMLVLAGLLLILKHQLHQNRK